MCVCVCVCVLPATRRYSRTTHATVRKQTHLRTGTNLFAFALKCLELFPDLVKPLIGRQLDALGNALVDLLCMSEAELAVRSMSISGCVLLKLHRWPHFSGHHPVIQVEGRRQHQFQSGCSCRYSCQLARTSC